MIPLEDILSQVYPKFNLDLKNPGVVVDENPSVSMESGYTGAIDYDHIPDIFNKSETRFLDGITFRIPSELSEDQQLATAYFAHECSHLDLLKKPYHVGYFIALTLANKTMQPFQEMSQGTREPSSTKIGKAKMLASLGVRLAVYVPCAAYGNFVERIVDRNAKAKGFDSEISTLREKYPLKMFK
jgi:hypothetical protein